MAGFSVTGYEREKRPEAFEVTLSTGEVVVLSDPKKMHYSAIVEMDSLAPMQQLEKLLLTGADKFKADPEMDGEMVEAIMSAWRDHYGLDQGGA